MTIDLSRFDWQGVSGVSDVLMVMLNVILIVSVIVGYRSLKESVMSRDATLLVWAMERMTAIKRDLRALGDAPPYGSLQEIRSPGFTSPWTKDLEKAAYRVSVELQRLSYMANSGLISKVHFRKMWGANIAEAWELLETWVKHRRLTRGEPTEVSEGADTRRDFELFAKECATPAAKRNGN